VFPFNLMVSKLLALYLVYILPYIEFLEKELDLGDKEARFREADLFFRRSIVKQQKKKAGFSITLLFHQYPLSSSFSFSLSSYRYVTPFLLSIV